MFERWSDDSAGRDPVAFGHDGSGGQHLWIFPKSRLVMAHLRDNRLPDNRGYDQGTPAQQFRDLVRLGAALEEASMLSGEHLNKGTAAWLAAPFWFAAE